MIEDVANSTQALWMVISGFIIAFTLAFGIGANDVANSFGTSVGSKVLTLKQACILATIFEILGSILIGAKVSGTIRKGILDPNVFADSEMELMLGYVSALLGCCIWLIVATVLNLPVSGTHSIVGATIGMALVSRGVDVIKWVELLKIVASWLISPLLSGLVSMFLFILIRKYILRAQSPLKAGLTFLPIIYMVTIVVNVGGILESSPPMLKFDKIPGWGKILIGIGLAVVVYLSVWLLMVPYMKKMIQKQMATANLSKVEEAVKELLPSGLPDDETDYEGGVEKKKSIATQVDHIILLLARTYPTEWQRFENDKEREEERMQLLKQQQNTELIKQGLESGSSRGDVTIVSSASSKRKSLAHLMKQQQHQQTVHAPSAASAASHPQSVMTLAAAQNPFIRSAIKHGRIRFESAPSNADEVPDIDDVNLTLGGYLHSSATSRQHLMTLRHYIRPTTATTTSASARTPTSSKEPVGSAPHLRNIFQQPTEQQKTADSEAQTTSPAAADGRTSPAEGGEGGKKFGRFVATKVEKDNLLKVGRGEESTKALVGSSKESINVDTDALENIDELPSKKKKDLKKAEEVDIYAHTDPPEAAKLFSFLQVLTAVFGSFAHGGNDVSNAIGPLIGLYLIFQEGRIVDKAETPEWILFYGGVGISMGLWILGRRVIKTIGEDLTKITPSSGFVIELASALTVLVASLVNIPVSTTHCKVGSVVFTGRVRSKQSVDWSLFRNIIVAWIVTVPVTGGIAAGCQAILKAIFIK